MNYFQNKVISKYSTIRFFSIIFLSVLFIGGTQETDKTGKRAPRPLFRDPIYDGAADPVVIWNQREKNGLCFIRIAGQM
jgi:hypothetical protein